MLGNFAFSALPISAIFDDNSFVVTAQTNYAKIPAGSALFSPDQQVSCVVNTWNTPFTPLDSNLPSAGLVLDAQGPNGATTWSAYLAGVKGAAAASLYSSFTQSSTAYIRNGRVPNVFDSWGAGAPAWYGAEAVGQVGLHYGGTLRPVLGRSWFSTSTAVTFSLALAGAGYVRVTKTISGVTTDVNIAGQVGCALSEQDFLDNGLRFTDVLTLNPGDGLDIYYVQNGDVIGGLVAKAVLGSASAQTLTNAQAAPVLGCGLLDDGAPPAVYSLPNLDRVEVQCKEGAAFTATVQLPLINPDSHDGFGYVYRMSESDQDDQYLDVWNGGQVAYQLRKGRLIQISMGEPGKEFIVFTGVIKDFGHVTDGKLPLECLSFEHRLLETHTKNEPDEISYMCAGYNRTVATSQPVYNIAAYDNWTMEAALADMLYRGGVDASRMSTQLFVSKSTGTSTAVSYNGENFKTFRARNVLGKPLRLERPVHYGNAGDAFSEVHPVDDAYKFPPENLKELWNRARDITDRYGYDLRFNSQGNVVLSTRANASYCYDFATSDAGGAGTLKTHPSAFEGTYIEFSTTEAPTVTKQVTGARIDIAFPRGAALGGWYSVVVTRASDNKEMARVLTLDVSAAQDLYYYDFRLSPDGTNATLYTVFSGDYDTYNLTLTPTQLGTADGKVRRLDSVFVYHTDPITSKYPGPLSTDTNAITVDQSGAADEMRNLVYVVGSRKTTATDSAKLKTNPNNPDPEFIVSAAVDLGSITDPTASNYIGLKREAMIVDPSIGDQDYADYLSRTVIYRYRTAKPPAAIKHTLLPVVELRDPVQAAETVFDTVNARRTLFVVGFTHVFDRTGYVTQLDTTAFPEFPSYEVRSDIDIDANFNGLPVTNVEVSYTSLTGQLQTNRPSQNVVHTSADADVVVTTQTVHAGPPEYFDLTGQPWPPVPGTLFFTQGSGQGTSSATVTNPSTIPTSPALVSQLLTAHPGEVFGTLQLNNCQSITQVTLTTWRPLPVVIPLQPTAAVDSTQVLSANPPLGSTFYYNFDQVNGLLRVYYKKGPLTPSTPIYFTVSVSYLQGNQKTLTDNPYHHLTNIDYRASNPKVYLPWKQGDQTATYLRNTGVTSYQLKYRALRGDNGAAFVDPYTGNSPFFDPYTSQVGQLVKFRFDALVSGLYRISVRSVFEPDTVVAYLSEPTADASVPEEHWQYLTAGADKEFFWDGVDQVGQWNLEQSAEAAALTQGVFDSADIQPIGAGWYAWNREAVPGDYGPLALISGDLDAATGKPVFGHGTYSAWFFQVECKNDDLAELALANPGDPSKQLPRLAATIDPDPGKFAPTYTTGSTSAVCYMHLPDPTQAELLLDDWVAGFAFDPNNPAHVTTDANWGAADADATINTQKPVRVRFNVLPRPGALWATQQGEADVKVTRHVHPRVYFFDQLLVNAGTQYASNNQALTAVEERTLYTRRFENNTHTIEFTDTGYRKAKTFLNPTYPAGTAVWAFTPDSIKKNFRGIDNEPLKFMDYLQLEEVPNWDPNKAAGSAHSRHLLGFMAYLFYLSAFVQDRSGRRVWCMNRSFLDQSKITTTVYGDWWAPTTPGTAATASTFKAELPVDPTRQFKRSIVCRQWTNEGTWIADQTAQWGFGTGVGASLLKHKWSDHEPGSTNLAGAAWPVLDRDDYSHWHTDGGRTQLPTTFNSMNRQLGGYVSSAPTTRLGTWTWEYDALNGGAKGGLWIPCVTRDWHPYYVVPPMADSIEAQDLHGNSLMLRYIYGIVDPKAWDPTPSVNSGGDVAKQATWQSWVRGEDETYDSGSGGNKRFFVGQSVDPTRNPNNPPPPNVMNYVRQDELTHYESLRGIYTRGPRPAEQPKKLTPDAPYYSNPLRYGGFLVQPARNQASQSIPDIYTWVKEWFRMAFRSEYVVESAAHFPVDNLNREYLAAFNLAKTRFGGQLQKTPFYDAGAWTGWKDDNNAAYMDPGIPATRIIGDATANLEANLFDSVWMAVATGPELPQTKELYFHMVLLDQRRDVPV